MSCEPMMQIPASRQSSSDPYVFTEPPSIQTLQLHKATTSSKSPYSSKSSVSTSSSSPGGTTKPPTHHRHNVNESLKKKLGIAHIKVPPHTPPPSAAVQQFSSSQAAALSGASSSPMISGSGMRTSPTTTNTSKKGTGINVFPAPRRQSEPTLPNEPTNNNKKSTRESSRGPRGKYAKREPKKTSFLQSRVTGPMTFMHSQIRDSDLLQIPSEFWYGSNSESNSSSLTTVRHWYLPEISDSVPVNLNVVPSSNAAQPDSNSVNNKKETSSSPAPPPLITLSRDERLELKRNELRRRTIQLRRARQHRDIIPVQRRFILAQALLTQSGSDHSLSLGVNVFGQETGRQCAMEGCSKDALVFTDLCTVHHNSTEGKKGDKSCQKWLFAPCEVKSLDNKQCQRVPVFDTNQEVSLCIEHAREKVEKCYNKAGGRGEAKEVKRGKKRNNSGRINNNSVKVTSTVPTSIVGGGSVKKATLNPIANLIPVYTPPQQKRNSNNIPINVVMKPNNNVQSQQPLKRIQTKHNNKVYVSPAKTSVTVQGQSYHPVIRQKPRPEMLTRFTKGQSGMQQQSRSQILSAPRGVTMMMMQHEHDDFVDEDDSVGLGGEEYEEEEEESSSARKMLVVKRRRHITNNQTDLLLVSENSSAYESSEDTGVGGLSESEMIEEIGFDSQFLEDPEFNNVLDDLLAVEQHGEMFDAMSVDDDVKVMEMTGTSTFLGDFLADQMLSSSGAVQNMNGVRVAGGGGTASKGGHLIQA